MASIEHKKTDTASDNNANMVEHVDGIHVTYADRTKTTPYMTVFAIVIAFSGWMMGFDTGYSGTVLQMEPFNEAFGTCIETPAGVVCRLGATAQSISSISQLFTGVGSAFAGVSANYLGRRWGIYIGCVLVIIGAAGQLGISSNYTSYMVCKSIAGAGVGHFQVIALTYGAECVAPRKRGLLLACFSVGLALGSFVCSAVCLGSSTLTTNWAWKTPIACQIPISIIYIFVVMMFPESPRWLMIKGREEEARRSFGKFYGADPFSETVSSQIEDTKSGLEFEKLISASTSWTEIFHRSYVRRTIISCAILVGGTLSGTYFVGPYAAIFLAGVGIRNPFLINVYFGLCGVGGSVVGPVAVEFVGRRISILFGYGLMACSMLIFSAVSTGLGSTSTLASQVLVAFLCIWVFSYFAFIVPGGFLASSEVHSVSLRGSGQAFVGVIAQVTTFAASFWTPYMLNKQYGNMGTNVGYFYFGMDFVIGITMFFLVPETARLTLEQIDDIFASKTPAWKTSIKKNKEIAKTQGVVLSAKDRLEAIQNPGKPN
jgi:SP family sugar:H+ symporter-like MFS transporter